MGTILVIGGGAAGLAAAVAAGEAARSGGFARELKVVLCEADERVGRSILATGNGRCNFSNAFINPALYRNASFVAQALGASAAGACEPEESKEGGIAPLLTPDQQACRPSGIRGKGALGGIDPADEKNPVHRFFAEHGLVWREDDEGRLYPATNKATTVLEVLRAAASACGVREVCGMRAVRVVAPAEAGGAFHVHFENGAVEHADAVIVACGGHTGAAAARKLLPSDLPYCKPSPVLGPLNTETGSIRALDNIRVRCAVELRRGGEAVAREEGEVLFRSYGVSGIAVFNLSRFASPGDELSLDLFPSVTREELQGALFARRKRLLRSGALVTCGDALRGMTLPLVAEAVLARAGLRASDELAKAAVPRIAWALKEFSLEVRGVADPKRCQVTRGGFDVEAFDPFTLQAKAHPGLYVVGELLDVDAPCGGYNLHWAFASGLAAGEAAAYSY